MYYYVNGIEGSFIPKIYQTAKTLKEAYKYFEPSIGRVRLIWRRRKDLFKLPADYTMYSEREIHIKKLASSERDSSRLPN